MKLASTSKLSAIALALPFGLSLVACSGEVRDELPFESRSAYVEDAADTACDRINECGEIGNDKTYRTYDDCVVAQTEGFNDLWPSDQCEGERINGAKFDDCMARASSMACDGFSSLADAAAFSNECNADKVCTDAP